MYINRAILFIAGLFFIFYPAVDSWTLDGDTTWYRPFLLWLLVIVATYWNQRSRFPDEL
jgi:hypothetical protein